MDILSDILEGVKSEGIITGRFSLSAPWGFIKKPADGACFRIAADNPFWISVKDAAPVRIEPGDLVLLPHGDAHNMMSSPDAALGPFESLVKGCGIVPDITRPLAFRAGGGGPVTELYTGIVQFRERRRNSMLAMLPDMIHIRAAEIDVSTWFTSTLKCFVEESMGCEAGWRFAAARLADLLLLHVLRIYLHTESGGGAGWLRGLRDPQIGAALLLMHKQPQRDWTVHTLAAEVAMSRSRFDARFRELVGESPISYLTARRMHQACEYLASRRYRLADIAERVGYASEKGFARAFRRWSGMAPSMYLRLPPERA
jgi:AraC-like DNA-binding protein